MAGHAAAMLTVDHRLLLHADRMDGRGGLDVGKWHFHGVLDRMQQLDHDIRHITERQLATLIPSRTSGPARLADGTPHLQRVKQERLHVSRVRRCQSGQKCAQGAFININKKKKKTGTGGYWMS